MWANILFALLTLLPVASCESSHKSLAAFFYFHFVLSVSFLLFFSLLYSSFFLFLSFLPLCSACCSDKNLNNSPNVPSWNVKIPNDFALTPCLPYPPLATICLAEVGKRCAVSGLAELKSRLPNDCKWMAANDCECCPRVWPHSLPLPDSPPACSRLA